MARKSNRPRRRRNSRHGSRAHSNTKGRQQIKSGAYLRPLKRLAKELGVPFRSKR